MKVTQQISPIPHWLLWRMAVIDGGKDI